MKKILLFLIVIILLGTEAFAQSTYSYNFNNNLHESSGTGTDLIDSCGTGAFTKATLPIAITKYVYTFSSGCGLTFDDGTTGFLASGSYTIELYAELDTVDGYRKLIDFKSRTSDNGFYNQGGTIALYPYFHADSSSLMAGQYEYIVLTRDASTGNMFMYVNNTNQGSYTDTGGDYIYGAGKKLIFFEDDLGTGSEQTSGSVAMIHISNYAMDSNTIKNNYSKLATTLNVKNTLTNNTSFSIYPNPATGSLHIQTPTECSYRLCDITGRTIQTGNFMKGSNTIDLYKLKAAIYIITVTDNTGSSTYKIIKE